SRRRNPRTRRFHPTSARDPLLCFIGAFLAEFPLLLSWHSQLFFWNVAVAPLHPLRLRLPLLPLRRRPAVRLFSRLLLSFLVLTAQLICKMPLMAAGAFSWSSNRARFVS